MGSRKFWIQLDRSPKQRLRRDCVVAFEALAALQEVIIGHQIMGWLAPRALRAACGHAPLDRCRYGLGYLILDCEYVPHIAIIVFRPQLIAGRDIDHTRSYPDMAQRRPDAAFDNILNPQLPTDTAEVICFVAIAERGVASDHE